MKPRLVAHLDVAAASGLVVRGEELLVIADDELTLHRYDRAGRPLGTIALFGDAPLPEEHRARKKAKPDLEALALLPDGSLLALGSGSKPNRDRGAWLAGSAPREIDLSQLYGRLRGRWPALNVEGAVVRGDSLLLAHRDNAAGNSALIVLDLRAVLTGLATRRVGGDAVHDAVALRLDARLAPTDLALRDGEVWFAAAAEDTGDPYEDGKRLGSAIGRLRADLTLASIEPIQGDWKIEGLAATEDGWLMVADADDRASPAPLLTAP